MFFTFYCNGFGRAYFINNSKQIYYDVHDKGLRSNAKAGILFIHPTKGGLYMEVDNVTPTTANNAIILWHQKIQLFNDIKESRYVGKINEEHISLAKKKSSAS